MMKKFTLIELLVIVAIFGILVSILLPSFQRAREKAEQAVCMSNLKQINFATASYSAKSNNFYPQSYGSRRGGYVSWDDQLSGYDGRSLLTSTEQLQSFLPVGYPGSVDIYRCPSSPSFLPQFANYGNGFMRSYALNQWHHRGSSKLGISQANGKTGNLAAITDPAKTIAYVEKKWCAMSYVDDLHSASLMHYKLFNPSGPLDYGGKEFHQRLTNYAMIDGSVKSMNFWATLERKDGSVGTINDVQETYWDSAK